VLHGGLQAAMVLFNRCIAEMPVPDDGAEVSVAFQMRVTQVEIVGTVVSKAVRPEVGTCGATACALPVCSNCIPSPSRLRADIFGVDDGTAVVSVSRWKQGSLASCPPIHLGDCVRVIGKLKNRFPRFVDDVHYRCVASACLLTEVSHPIRSVLPALLCSALPACQ
jgi:hypothetical protein